MGDEGKFPGWWNVFIQRYTMEVVLFWAVILPMPRANFAYDAEGKDLAWRGYPLSEKSMFCGEGRGVALYSRLYNSKYEHLREMSSVSKVNCVFLDNFECVWKKNQGKTFISSTKLHSSRLRCIYCINWLLPIKRLRVEAINALFYRNLIVLAIFSSISLLILQPFNI